jgi:hypothetical protein
MLWRREKSLAMLRTESHFLKRLYKTIMYYYISFSVLNLILTEFVVELCSFCDINFLLCMVTGLNQGIPCL